MTALLLLCTVPAITWLTQTALLRYYGLPTRWRLDSSNAPAALRTSTRAATYLSLLGVIAVYPLLQARPAVAPMTFGPSIVEYYSPMLPLQSAPHFVQGAACSVLCLSALFLMWMASDQLRIDIHQSRRRWMRRLILLLPTALLGGFAEELVFRGVLLADLLRALPQSPTPVIAIGALVFAAAHYLRRVKRWWTFPSHVVLGVLLCLAFVRTRTLWLPAGLHVGGIMMIMGVRPFFRYVGPPWLTGASIFPFAGVIGMLGLMILTMFVASHYGVTRP